MFQPVSTASHPTAVHSWQEAVSATFGSSSQVVVAVNKRLSTVLKFVALDSLVLGQKYSEYFCSKGGKNPRRLQMACKRTPGISPPKSSK